MAENTDYTVTFTSERILTKDVGTFNNAIVRIYGAARFQRGEYWSDAGISADLDVSAITGEDFIPIDQVSDEQLFDWIRNTYSDADWQVLVDYHLGNIENQIFEKSLTSYKNVASESSSREDFIEDVVRVVQERFGLSSQ